MLINDYSQQDFLSSSTSNKALYLELITAGTIFVIPILFLILIAS